MNAISVNSGIFHLNFYIFEFNAISNEFKRRPMFCCIIDWFKIYLIYS
jgi:hypothetical protein